MTRCQSCSTECIEVLDLGPNPLCNAFLKSKSQFKGEKFYPLKLVFCPGCTLVQLSEVLPQSLVFGKDFNYLTGSYPEAVVHFKALATKLMWMFGLKKGDTVLDIGSNDGTFLQNFKDKGIKVVGIEPAPKPAKIANANGIRTIVRPFEDCYEFLDEKPTLVTALNTLAHTSRIHDFLEGIKKLGVPFVSQSHYLPSMIRKVEYDMVYHEHSRFYTATSLSRLMWKHGLKLYDAEETPYLGGSFIAYASPEKLDASLRLRNMMASESDYGRLKTYETFAWNVVRSREWLQNALMEIKLAGKSVAGVGAPMKSSTLLNFCKIGPGWLDYTTELNHLKVGTYTPGMHIPVRAESRIFDRHPDYLLILAWNVADRIMESFRARGYHGKFIVPIPMARVVD